MGIQIPAFTDDLDYPFWHLRKMLSAFAAAGVTTQSDFVVSTMSGLQVQASAGTGFVQQTVNVEGGSAYNGLYLVVSDSAASPFNTISAPITNPRIDQIILRVYDVKEQGLGGTSLARLEWLPGSENASAALSTMGNGLSNPGAAALPANSLRLAYVLQAVGEGSISSGNIKNSASVLLAPSYDSGWIAMTLGSPGSALSTASGGYTPAYKQVGNIVLLSGGMTSAGAVISGTWATGLPHPASTVNIDISITGASPTPTVLSVSTSGVMTLPVTSSGSITVPLDSLSYRVV